MDGGYEKSGCGTVESYVGDETEGGKERLALHGMKLDIPDEERERIIKALDNYHAYTVARNAEDRRYPDLADRLKRKPTERVEKQPGEANET